MPRIARVVEVGMPHHVTQRGNNEQDIFQSDTDREKYLLWIQEYSSKYDLLILAYCLMLNHVHFIVVPVKEDSLAKVLRAVHMRYAQYFNKKEGRTGHLWQNRFFSCVMDESHLISAVRYVELNPVRAHMVEKAWHWKWSSARFHVNEGTSLIRLGDFFKYTEISQESWRMCIETNENEQELDKLRSHTLAGRPLGEQEFIEKMELKFNTQLRIMPKGRPWGLIK